MILKKDYSQELEQLNKMLGTDIGIISLISGKKYTVVQIYSNFGSIGQGDRFITEDTYCSEVVVQENMVTYDQIGRIRSMILHPIYTAMQLESYIGVPIFDAHEYIIGTLNFSGLEPKANGFSELEIAKVSLLRDIIQLDAQTSN